MKGGHGDNEDDVDIDSETGDVTRIWTLKQVKSDVKRL
jgi:hypothetical protein